MRNERSPLSSISRLGFGAWAIGGPYEHGWGAVDDAQSLEAIHQACDSGLNWIDTAPAYGCGHSEEIVGRAVKSRPGRLSVFTKCGRVWDSTGKVASDLRPSAIRTQWKESIVRLGVDVIDLYQIHRPDEVTGTPLGDSWAEMAKLLSEGKVRAIGLCNVSLAQYLECASIHPVDALQTPVNILRSGDSAVRVAAHQAGTAVLAYSPMESGLLSGAFDKARVAALDRGDWRGRSSKFSADALAYAAKVIEELEALSETTGHSIPSLAVAWSLRQPGVSASIVGARRPDQVLAWQDAALIRLEESTWERVDQLARR